MLPPKVKNLLVAGRCVAGDKTSHAAMRNMMACTVTGILYFKSLFRKTLNRYEFCVCNIKIAYFKRYQTTPVKEYCILITQVGNDPLKYKHNVNNGWKL